MTQSHTESSSPGLRSLSSAESASSRTNTQRKLTKEHDKLPAIAGLARVMTPANGAIYLAGFWRNGFAEELLWYPAALAKDPRHNDLQAPMRWRAPSWTWASVDGAVKFWSYFDEDLDIEVVDASPGVKGIDPYGEVAYGSATLHGPVAHLDSCFISQTRSEGTGGKENLLDLEPVPEFLIESLSDNYQDWETRMPHNGGRHLDPRGLESSLWTWTDDCELRCEVRFDAGQMPVSSAFRF
jgi:hypothetical protein